VSTRPPGSRRGWALALGLALAWSLASAGLGSALNAGGWRVASRFARAALAPDLSASYLAEVGAAALTTLSYAVLGAGAAVVLGLAGAVAASRTGWAGRRPGRAGRSGGPRGRAGWLAARALLAVPRGVHEAVWALLLVVVLGPGPLAAVVAIAVPFGAITAGVFADLLDGAPRGPYEALLAAGSGRVAAACYGLLPAVAPDLVSYALYRFDCAVRSAVVLGIVGAGGLGLLLDGALADLSYARMWTCIDALVVLCTLGVVLSRRVRARLAVGGRTPARTLALSVVGAALACAAAWGHLRLDLRPLASQRVGDQVGYLAGAAWPPALPAGGVRALVDAAAATLQMALLATAAAVAVAVVLAPLAAHRPEQEAGARLVSALCRGALVLARAVPAPVWVLLALFVSHPGVLPGAVGLAVHEVGVLGRLAGEAVEDLDPAPERALRAAGAGRAAAFAYGTLPRAAPQLLAYTVYRGEVVVREAVVVGLVGAGGLGYLLARQSAAFDWRAAVTTVAAFVVLTWAVDLLGVAARRTLR